jgi:hypothetical protein
MGMSVREFLERATLLIIRESERFPNFDKRIDIEVELNLLDPKIGRAHRVRTKLRVTSVSELFVSPADETNKKVPL